ncbi:MAG: DUF3081 family protein [Alteromonadaceae bacterium]|jgi:hypothetical protein
MNNREIQLRDFLQIYDAISTNGVKVDGVYEYLDIKAWHDFDGYTCWIGYKDLTITLLFHGRFDMDYKYEDTLKQFYKITPLLTAN